MTKIIVRKVKMKNETVVKSQIEKVGFNMQRAQTRLVHAI